MTQQNWKEGLKELLIKQGLDLEDRGEETEFGSIQIWHEQEHFIEKTLAQQRKEIVEIIESMKQEMICFDSNKGTQVEYVIANEQNHVNIIKNNFIADIITKLSE